MKVGMAGRWMVRTAVVLLSGAVAMAQGQGGMGQGRMGQGAMRPGAMGRGPAFTQQRPPVERALGAQGKVGQWWNNPRMVEQLKLSDDQRKAMDGILLQHREHLIDLRGTLQKAELEMQPMMKADQPNENQILGQIDKVAQARAELEKANARFLMDLRGKLTPDQWKQVQQLRANGMQPPPPGGQGQGQQRSNRPRMGQGGQPDGNPPPPPQGGPGGPGGMGDMQ